ncbi:hypothetical protein, partial [Parageobacillus toebii]|uniref:hypothetical protein n=1 Tax=Parageobacillus toebii TaxID=153151 RepID=UPI002E21245A|nr:hypothetical protein [Parageobacillus toebii]
GLNQAKNGGERLAPKGKCSSPVEVLAPQGRRLFGARELGTGARQRKSGSRLCKTASSKRTVI